MVKRRRLSDDEPAQPAHQRQSREPAPKRRFFGKSHLLALPQELILRVLHFLPVQSLLTVSRTSQKLHSLASDQQLWKTKFWAKFILPRLQRRARLSLPESYGSREPEPGIVTDWKMWLEDHVLLQEERDLVALAPSPTPVKQPSKELVNKKPSLDWKGKFRLRSNWQRGVARPSEVKLLDSISKHDSKAPPITGKFYEVGIQVPYNAAGLGN